MASISLAPSALASSNEFPAVCTNELQYIGFFISCFAEDSIVSPIPLDAVLSNAAAPVEVPPLIIAIIAFGNADTVPETSLPAVPQLPPFIAFVFSAFCASLSESPL